MFYIPSTLLKLIKLLTKTIHLTKYKVIKNNKHEHAYFDYQS